MTLTFVVRGHINWYMSIIVSHSPSNILETVRVRGLVPTTNSKWPMGITWPMTSHDPKGQVVTNVPIRLESNIVKTAGDAI